MGWSKKWKDVLRLKFDNKKENYEYSDPVELTEDKARYIKVPMQIITDTEENINRVAVYAYISMYKGLNSKMGTP